MSTLCQLALASFLYAAAPAFDTVLLQNGGRIVGTVVEESPVAGVTIQIPGGQLRTVAPGEVFRIEYRDGTFGVVGGKAEPAAAPAPAPPAEPAAPALPDATPEPPRPPAPAASPEAPRPPAPPGAAQPVYPAVPVQPGDPRRPHGPYGPRPGTAGRPFPLMLAFGLGLAAPGGNATPSGSPAPGGAMSDTFQPQLLVELEGGLRLTPHVMASLVMDLGFGDAATQASNRCRSFGGSDCTAFTGRFGLQVRYAFTPLAPSTTWISLGTAGEVAMVSYDASSSSNDLVYTGWEVVRLGAGIDFRSSRGLGWGAFVNAGFGRYSEVDDGGFVYSLDRTSLHTWVQAGLRIILFP